jgi:acyl-CoA hydrolase
MLSCGFRRFYIRGSAKLSSLRISPIPGRSPKVCKTAAEAVSVIESGKRVWLGDIAATPYTLVGGLVARARELRDVEIVSGWIGSPSVPEPFNSGDPDVRRAFRTNLYFVSPSSRPGYRQKYPHARYIPMGLGEACDFNASAVGACDYAMVMVSAPDKHGWCSCGIGSNGAPPALERAGVVLVEVNKRMPRTHGNTFFHMSHFDSILEVDRPLPQFPSAKPSRAVQQIGKNVAELIPDGACIQAGISGLSDSVMANLHNHKDLGIHAEMLGDGVVDLANTGVVTGRYKVTQQGKIVASLAMGTQKLYDAIDDNPQYWFDCAGYTNDCRIASQNPKLHAINAALEVDLTGQVSADTIQGIQFGGVGGQVEFLTSAAMSQGGRPIIALPATAKKGTLSRIVPRFAVGTSVTTSRWIGVTVVTEFGVADLWGLNTRQRATALIKLAHPKFREELEKTAAEQFGYQ